MRSLVVLYRRLAVVRANPTNMRNWVITFSAGSVLFFALSCERATSTYPSYERALAKLRPAQDGAAPNAPPCDPNEDTCNCPRIWAGNRWMFDCDGQWMYREMGYWVHDPFFYMYDTRDDEAPAPAGGAGRRIIKQEK